MTLAEALRHDVYQTKRELAAKLRVTPRDVEQMVERARKSQSLPIMSGPDGYRLARNPDEYAMNVERRHRRALVQLVTVQGEKALLERWRARLSPPEKPAAVQESLQW